MRKWLLGVVANLMVMAVAFDVSNMTCIWIIHQPEVPQNLRR